MLPSDINIVYSLEQFLEVPKLFTLNLQFQVAVIQETHGKILNATALKKQLKGPYGESDVIGGMMSGGY